MAGNQKQRGRKKKNTPSSSVPQEAAEAQEETPLAGQPVQPQTAERSRARKRVISNGEESETNTAGHQNKAVVDSEEEVTSKHTERNVEQTSTVPEGSKPQKRKYRRREGESKLAVEKRTIEEARQLKLRKAFAKALNISFLMWEAGCPSDDGFKSGLEALALCVAATSVVSEIHNRFDRKARKKALTFVADVLSRGSKGVPRLGTATDKNEKKATKTHGERSKARNNRSRAEHSVDREEKKASMKDISRLHKRNIGQLYGDLVGDLSKLLHLNIDTKVYEGARNNSIHYIDNLCGRAVRLVKMSTESFSHGRTAFFGYLTPCLALSVGLAYAVEIRQGNRSSTTDFLERFHQIYTSWQRLFLDGNILLKASDKSLMEHGNSDAEVLYSALLTPLLFKVMFRILKSSIGKEFAEMHRLARSSLREASRYIGETIRSLPRFSRIGVDSGQWKHLCTLLKACAKNAKVSLHAEMPDDICFHLRDSSTCRAQSFRQDVWEHIDEAREAPRNTALKKAKEHIEETGNQMADLCKWLVRVNPEGSTLIQPDDAAFSYVVDILEDGLNCLRQCMELGTHIFATLDPRKQDIDIPKDVVAEITGDEDTDMWIATVIRTLSLGVVGPRSSGSLLHVYEQKVVTLYLNRLNPSTGERNLRAPLRETL